MRRAFGLAVVLPLLLLEARAALGAGETVTYTVGKETVRAYLAKPPNSFNLPGIVVLHEWWGLNDQIMGVADRLARTGYVAIAPDLYRGKLTTDPGLAQDMMRALDEGRAVAIVKGAIDYLRGLDRVSNRPVGTVGFGMGGRISLATALQGTDVQATVLFYGRVETTAEALAPIRAPLLGIFGDRDHEVPAEEAKKFEQVLKDTGKDATIIIYPGTAHAFFNEMRPDYEPQFAKDAWVRMRDWLMVKLRPLPAPRGLREPPLPAPTPPGS